MRRVALAAVAALALAPTAAGGNVATPKMAEVASWAARTPLTVWCETDADAWNALLAQHRVVVRAGFIVDGFTNRAAPVVYIGPTVCSNLVEPTGMDLGIGLNVLLHEAYTHYGGGIRDQAIQECGALVLQYEALRRFYGVPFFSMRMRQLTELALAFSRSKPADYQGGCARL